MSSTKNHKGFILLVSLIVMVVVAALILDWLQQEILLRVQSQAFLDTQALHQELKGVSIESLIQLQTQTRSQLEQSSFSLPATSFSSAYSNWSGNTNFSSSKRLLKLTYNKTGAPLDFEILLHLDQKDVTHIPWIVFNPTEALFPNNLNLDNPSKSSSSQATALFWLAEATSTQVFNPEITGNTELFWNNSGLLITQSGVFYDNRTLTDNGSIALKVNGTLEVNMDFEVVNQNRILIQSTGDLTLKLPEKAQSFSTSKSVTFLDVGGVFKIRGKNTGDTHLQVNAYLHGRATNCLQFNTALQTIYWKGSIVCDNSPTVSTQMYLKQSAFTDNGTLGTPPAFMRDSLQSDGVRLLKMD